ncbi:MAG: 3-deoxy-manno-octulosonate cytidylyltransferase [Eggerthellaceae bacterium]|nr:3-deoxy-manno-octulosonate cytidylyltransferase [Eggerthellaceae bacterium]
MKIVGVIPARYASTRLPGKPLANICGKPMVWWVYNRVKEVAELTEVFVAVDDECVADEIEAFGIKCIMTKKNHPEHISRIHEVSDMVDADFYICVNGDEPLIDPRAIRRLIPSEAVVDLPYFQGATRVLTNPAETIDNGNIKLALTNEGTCVYLSRTPVPYPQGSLAFRYMKYVGIECFNKAALDFFVDTPRGELETVEDIDHLRFVENGIPIRFTEVDSTSISVDTQKDLEFVRTIIEDRIAKGEIKL